MNPPTRQKLKHDRSLRREHIRVLSVFLRLALFVGEARARVVDWLSRLDFSIARLNDAAGGVRGGAEFVGLGEGAFGVVDVAAVAVALGLGGGEVGAVAQAEVAGAYSGA